MAYCRDSLALLCFALLCFALLYYIVLPEESLGISWKVNKHKFHKK
jgi:hypothetical protein